MWWRGRRHWVGSLFAKRGWWRHTGETIGHDLEHVLGVLSRAACDRRGDNTVLQVTPIANHQSLEATRGVASQVRALKLFQEERFQRTVRKEETCISWLMRHSAWCATRYLDKSFWSNPARDGEKQEVLGRSRVLRETSWARAHRAGTRLGS